MMFGEIGLVTCSPVSGGTKNDTFEKWYKTSLSEMIPNAWDFTADIKMQCQILRVTIVTIKRHLITI